MTMRGSWVLLLLWLTACTVEPRPDRGARSTTATEAEATSGVRGPDVDHLTTPGTEALGYPFSEAVRVGDMLYLSGQVGNLPGEAVVVPGGIVPEARQTMENIRTILERWGSSLERVVKCTVMIDEIEEWGAFNEVYVEYFPGPKPARSAFGADGLALGAAVEVECWATVDPSGG